jgi:hypothetical protein
MELTACEKCKNIRREEYHTSDWSIGCGIFYWWRYDCKCNLEPIKEFRPITGKEEIIDYKKCIDCNNGKCNNFDFDENYITQKEAQKQLQETKRKEDMQQRLEEEQKIKKEIYESSFKYKLKKWFKFI